MPSTVSVDISHASVIAACNTPGGPIYEWRDRTATVAIGNAQGRAPVNNPLNAMHRGGVVGTYRASFGWDRTGSHGHLVSATIFNDADHAIYVEEGRSASLRHQTFSWTRWGGRIRTVDSTRRRPGTHVLMRSVEAAVRETS